MCAGGGVGEGGVTVVLIKNDAEVMVYLHGGKNEHWCLPHTIHNQLKVDQKPKYGRQNNKEI